MTAMRPIASIEHYRFGPFELHPDKRRLLTDGATTAPLALSKQWPIVGIS